MSPDQQSGSQRAHERTVKTAGRIVKYSREIYHLESVEEIAMMTLEAAPHFIDGHPTPTVIEIRRDDDLRVLESMDSAFERGDDPGKLARQAYESDTVVICAAEGVTIAYEGEEMTVVDPSTCGCEKQGGVTMAAPTVYSDEIGDTGAILLLHWPALERIEEYHVKPVDYLAEHVATAIVNVRSRQRLERARNDLAKRKEMVEVYDRLLRHDLGNDLQIITGFSDAVVSMVDDEQASEYAEKINKTAQSAAELIDNVGQTVKVLQQEEGEPDVQELEPILSGVVENVDRKFDTLTVEYEPSAFEYSVYAGDLIESVFTNILSNAVVHNHGEVTISLYAEEPSTDRIVVGMADDGAGIPESIRENIFEMGKKGPESDGTGFGLGLARTLVESYGGAVEVRESEWGGADFRITLERA